MYISLAIRGIAPNPIQKNHERKPHQLLMKVADYSRRFYTCNIHHKPLMIFQYDVTADVLLVISARVWRFYAETSRRTEPGSKTSCLNR